MNISSGINLIHTAQLRSENAAKAIVNQSLPKTDAGGVEFSPESLIKPVLNLKKAELETAAATKIIEAQSKTIDAILDIEA
jgi:hypothetical protein